MSNRPLERGASTLKDGRDPPRQRKAGRRARPPKPEEFTVSGVRVVITAERPQARTRITLERMFPTLSPNQGDKGGARDTRAR